MGEGSGRGSGRVRLFVSNRGSGRVNVSPGRVGSEKVTRGQLWAHDMPDDASVNLASLRHSVASPSF